MAGTMPHAIFVETGLDDGATVAAYAAELPGCAVFAATDAEATNAMPRRVAWFVDWLRAAGEQAPMFVGDNWYEVERAAVRAGANGPQRAAFSLDELPPSADEFGRHLRWLELARELLADALDAAGEAAPLAQLEALERGDRGLAAELDGAPGDADGGLIDRLYQARDALTSALEAAGATGDGVRRAIRLAIADDLRVAGQLLGTGD
ncbi:MAG: hypothetical protein M3R32_06920 [Chloroflexota bacterium]|nr:hypothetical protein [Chloroflexota bacterium]